MILSELQSDVDRLILTELTHQDRSSQTLQLPHKTTQSREIPALCDEVQFIKDQYYWVFHEGLVVEFVPLIAVPIPK
jgi:hypothetical protein